MTAAIPLATGKPVKFRPAQMLLWKVIAGLLGAGFIAGLYFGILQADWHVFWLKPWWDHLFTQAWWPTYRHTAFRDIPEPAFAVMGVMTVMAGPKYWDKRVGTVRLVTAPFVLIAITFALAIGGTWVLNYGLPQGPGTIGHALAWHSAGNLILGAVVGFVLHRFWAPVGATLQGHLLERKAHKAAMKHRVPLWVRLPDAPPTLRERFSDIYSDYLSVGPHLLTGSTEDSANPWLVAAMVLVAVLITLLGLAGHYWVGAMHHSIPFIASH